MHNLCLIRIKPISRIPSGRFGTCPYGHVSYKIRLANAHFGQVWNLPLRSCILKNLLGQYTFRAGLEPAPTVTYPAKSNWTMHVSGRFGTCPYGHVSCKIQLDNTHFGQVWNLPLRSCVLKNLLGQCIFWTGLEPAPT